MKDVNKKCHNRKTIGAFLSEFGALQDQGLILPGANKDWELAENIKNDVIIKIIVFMAF